MVYLLLLGASLARAPWAPRLSLPGIGGVVTPAVPKRPPSLGANVVTTPGPVAVAAAPSSVRGSGALPGANPAPRGSQSGSAGGAGATNGGTSTTTTTTSLPPGLTRKSGSSSSSSTTTSGSNGTTTTTIFHGRPTTTTTTNPHRK